MISCINRLVKSKIQFVILLLGNRSQALDFEDAQDSNGLWHIASSYLEVGTYSPDDFPQITFSRMIFGLRLERKAHYYVLNLLVPAAFLIVMTLAVFLLPADSGEKVSLGITVLLSFSVLLLIIMDTTPRNSDHTPILCEFTVVQL